jgi:hypothetical protein
VAGDAAEARVAELIATVIVRLDRTIQYAAAFRLHRWRLRLLDAPLSRGMTTGENTKGREQSRPFFVTQCHHHHAVIVRLDRTIQYAAAFRLHRWRCVYWMPRFRGA